MFSMFDGQGEPGVNCTSHDVERRETNGVGAHRHRGPFRGISRGIAVRRYVRGQPLASSIRTAGALHYRALHGSLHGGFMEVSLEIRGGSMEVREGSVEDSQDVCGGSMELHGGS